LQAVIRILVMAMCVPGVGAPAQAGETPLPSVDKLIVVLRESPGANKQDETLRPMGKVKTLSADGKEIALEASWFQFIGDIHVRLVYDSPGVLVSATPQDLTRFGLSPEEAVQVAVANISRLYGPPRTTGWAEGPTRLHAGQSDFDSSYLLDRRFWRSLLKQHPEGVVVAVPKRHGLLFAPLTNARAVEYLRKHIPEWHKGDQLRVSSALYLFKDDRWTVFQPARTP
jgi:hypothetical protein